MNNYSVNGSNRDGEQNKKRRQGLWFNKNLMKYCEERKISVFKYVPFTIVFSWNISIT